MNAIFPMIIGNICSATGSAGDNVNIILPRGMRSAGYCTQCCILLHLQQSSRVLSWVYNVYVSPYDVSWYDCFIGAYIPQVSISWCRIFVSAFIHYQLLHCINWRHQTGKEGLWYISTQTQCWWLKWSSAITRLKAHLCVAWCLIWWFVSWKRWCCIHDAECPYWNQALLQNFQFKL